MKTYNIIIVLIVLCNIGICCKLLHVTQFTMECIYLTITVWFGILVIHIYSLIGFITQNDLPFSDYLNS